MLTGSSQDRNSEKQLGQTLFPNLPWNHCATMLYPVFTDIFNTSPETCCLPACLETSNIITVPKKRRHGGLLDTEPVALTPVVLNPFEPPVLSHLKPIIDPHLDPLQFTYTANRSVDDTIIMALIYILQHLYSPGTLARILIVEFSSAFNTVIPVLLKDKVSQLNVPGKNLQMETQI